MIVYCTSDLIFATKIHATAEAMGVPSRPARSGDMLQQRLDCIDDGKLNDAVTGVLVDLSLGDDAAAMIRQAKAANPDIPVVAFGSHVATALLQSARDAGADFVMARSQFVAVLPQLLEKYGGGNV